jgi:DNA-directed RNA polymerase subunit RPC12/RpoP
MAQVACPRCGAAQDAGADGYTCAGCGTVWAFATCDHCGASFHMRPGTTEWTCPDCGTEHGGTTMGQLEPDDAEPAARIETGQGEPDEPRRPAPTAATTRSARSHRRGGPPTRGRLAAIAVIGIVVVLGVAFALSSLGDDGGVASPAPSSTLDATQALCLHLRDLQTPREDSLARLADTLQADADTIQANGDPALAAKVLKLKAAVLAYRQALVDQGDLTDVAVKLGKATAAMPC